MEDLLASSVKELGGVVGAIDHIATLSRAMWQLILVDECTGGTKEKRNPYRNVKYRDLVGVYAQLCPTNRTEDGVNAILSRMLDLKICWQKGDVITYRPSVLNSITLTRQLLHGIRPDPDLRYFVWRNVRRYYRFSQSSRTAHYMHEFSATLNRAITERFENRKQAHLNTLEASWSICEDILPALKQKVANDFAIPIRITDFFLECCRLVNYIQLSNRVGCVELRTREFDAEYMLCQLFGIPTQIKGFDDLFGGGGLMLVESSDEGVQARIRGRAVLTVGPFGSGKSLLALQMAVEVARKGGIAWVMPMEQSREECMYALESMGCLPDGIPINVAESVPEALELLDRPEEDKGALILIRTVKDKFEDFAIAFDENAKLMGRYSLRLIVVDPVSAVGKPAAGTDVRASMLRLFDSVKQSGTNVWMVLEEGTGESLIEQNIADTVIHLRHLFEYGYSQRYIEITKSRLQREQRGLHAFSIAPAQGINVFPSSAAVRSRLQKRHARIPYSFIRLGYPVIDEAIGEGNLFAGDVIVLKGQSGSAKSSIAIAFLLSADLHRPREATDSSLLVTNVEAVDSASHQMEMVYSRLRKTASFSRTPQDITIVGVPGGFVKPGYILQQISNEFQFARIRRSTIARVALDNIVNMGFAAPFIDHDVTFGDTLIDLLRKERVTSLYVCRDSPDEAMTALQRSVLNAADCLIQFSREGPQAYFEVKKSRGMQHRRGVISLNLEHLEQAL
jgi:KaiC/GvpD/RAD55 family RecA-like ATPase